MAAILVTAGPTHEHLDDVRFLTNASSGRMGYAIAAAAVAAGHRAVLVSGPTALPCPAGVERIDVVSGRDMAARALAAFGDCDLAFGVAAVADHRPERRVRGKPAKQAGAFVLELVPNPDVIAGLAKHRRPDQLVVGFALESPADGGPEGVLARGREKLERKDLDMIVVNTPDAMGAEVSEVTVIGRDGAVVALPADRKEATARRLVERAVAAWQTRAAEGAR